MAELQTPKAWADVQVDKIAPVPIFLPSLFSFVIVSMIVMAVRNRRASASDPRESPALVVLLPLVPLALYSVFVVFVLRRYRGVFRRGWESQPQLHRPFVAEIDEHGLRLSEPLFRHEYHWDYFPGWIETENVFAIYISPVSFHLWPKRAFADEGARAEFRKLLQRMISDRANAFPVIPVATPRPLPHIGGN